MKEHIAKKKTWYFNTTVMDNLDDLKTLAEKNFFITYSLSVSIDVFFTLTKQGCVHCMVCHSSTVISARRRKGVDSCILNTRIPDEKLKFLTILKALKVSVKITVTIGKILNFSTTLLRDSIAFTLFDFLVSRLSPNSFIVLDSRGECRATVIPSRYCLLYLIDLSLHE